MNITKDIINDLIPLYAANECSADTRALVEEYLQQHPRESENLRRIMNTPMPATSAPAAALDEMESLRAARRLVRRRGWLLAAAIFFTLEPFSVLYTGGHAYWLFLESPGIALISEALAVVCWIAYTVVRKRSRAL